MRRDHEKQAQLLVRRGEGFARGHSGGAFPNGREDQDEDDPSQDAMQVDYGVIHDTNLRTTGKWEINMLVL